MFKLRFWAISVVLVCIFNVPRMFASAPSISDSYFFGYNNRVFELLLLISLLMLGYFWPKVKFAELATSERIPQRIIFRWMLAFAVAWVAMFTATHGTGGFGESSYLIDRLKMLISGATPYQDFEFAYGPIFLYGPRLLAFFGLTAETSYYVFWLFTLLSGAWVFAETLNMLDFSVETKSQVYSIFCTVALIATFTNGANYTLFRFIPASYFALIVVKLDPRDKRHRFLGCCAVVVSSMILLLISPEMSIAFTVGIIGYSLIREKTWGKNAIFNYLGMVFIEAFVLLVADKFNLFFTLKQFANGAYSFPIIPSGHILLFLFMCGLTAVYIANHKKTDPEGLVAVLAVSVCTIPAALGRCDAGHIFYASIGIVLAATLIVSTLRFWRIYRFAFVIFFIALPMITLMWSYKGLIIQVVSLRVFQSNDSLVAKQIERLMVHRLGESKARARIELIKESAVPFDQLGPEDTDTQEIPFGYTPNRLGIYHSDNIKSGYFDGLDNAFTPEAVKIKIDELASEPRYPLLLPKDFSCKIDMGLERKTIEVLFVYPFRSKVKHDQTVWEPLCSYIREHYRPAGNLKYGYEDWVPK